jgi:hypothetical protein
MTNDEWNRATDPEAMLAFLHASGTLSARKARLFAAACCRRIWPLLGDERSRRAIGIAERYADGLASVAELAAVACEATTACVVAKAEDGSRPAANAAEFAVDPDIWLAANGAAADAEVAVAARTTFDSDPARVDAEDRWTRAAEAEQANQAAVLRCIFRSPSALVAWLAAWLTPAVRTLAHEAYDEPSPDGTLDPAFLAALAQALSDAGCDDIELLTHLRGTNPHYRGCWGVDAVLSKG